MAASARAEPPVACVGILAGEYHFGYEDLFFEEAKAAGLNVEILHQDTGTLKVQYETRIHAMLCYAMLCYAMLRCIYR